jgi:4-amino-4-deoxy-L-arabinose transferase-like glycosyltransferase
MLMVIIGLFASILFGLGVSLKILRKENIIEIIATTAGFGFGVTGLIIFLENQMLGIDYSVYNSVFLSLIMLLIGTYLIITNKSVTVSFKIPGENYNRKNYNLIKIFLIILIFIYMVVLYKSAFFPSSEWDGIYYHLYIDKWVFEHKNLLLDVGTSNSEYVNAYPILSTWYGEYLMELNGRWDDIIFRLFSPVFSILTAFIIYLFALRMKGTVEAALLAVLFFISSPIVIFHSISTYIEMCFAFYVLLGLYFLFRYETQNESHYLILSGLFIGFSALAKYNGIAVFAAIVIYIFIKIIIGYIWKKGRVLTLYQIGILIFSFLVISVPFYIRNYLFFGDPLYPFLNGIFHGKNLSPFLVEATRGSELYISLNFYIQRFFVNFVEFPEAISGVMVAILSLTMINRGFWKNKDISIAGILIAILIFYLVSNPYYDGPIFYYFISVYGLFSIFTALWIMEEYTMPNINKKQIYFIAILTSVNFIILGNYFFSHPHSITRLIISFSEIISIVLFLIFIIFKWQNFNFINKIRLASKESWSRTILILAVVSMLIAPGLTVYKIRGNSFLPIPYDESIRNVMGDIYDVELWINSNTPENITILSFESRRYYLEREILPANSYRVEQMYKVKNIQDAISVLHDQGVEYILDSPEFRENNKLFDKSPIFINLNNTQFFELMYNKGKYNFYKIK